MRRRDQGIVAVLVALLAVTIAAVGLPGVTGGVGPSASAAPSAAVERPLRIGVVGRATAVNPLTARTQADRDLVALVFSGLLRLGPDGGLAPDLAATWQSDAARRTWTFELRPDARWHDGTPVTAADVAFTIDTLKDPSYAGPTAASWQDVTVSTLGERMLRFDLETPIGGFLDALTQPIVPRHLLADVPVAELEDAEFGRQPIGSGPFALVALADDGAVLRPAVDVMPEPAGAGGSARPTDSLASAAPTPLPGGARPYLDGIDVRFFDDAAGVEAAFRAGEVDTAGGFAPAVARELGDLPGAHLRRYPGSTLTTVVLNLRAGKPTFRDAAVRRALLQAIDRGAIIDRVYAGLAARADGPIPPASWAFDVTAAAPVAFDRDGARAALEAAGWKDLDAAGAGPSASAAPSASAVPSLQLLSPDEATNPLAYAAAAEIAEDWRAIGVRITHVGLPPDRLIGERLRTGDFDAAVIDVNIGLDPDLYPLLASSQATSRGLNLAGVQDVELDKLLVAARSPGEADARRDAFVALQQRLSQQQYLLPILFRDLAVVSTEALTGPSVHQVADPGDRFWDVLTWRLAADR